MLLSFTRQIALTGQFVCVSFGAYLAPSLSFMRTLVICRSLLLACLVIDEIDFAVMIMNNNRKIDRTRTKQKKSNCLLKMWNFYWRLTFQVAKERKKTVFCAVPAVYLVYCVNIAGYEISFVSICFQHDWLWANTMPKIHVSLHWKSDDAHHHHHVVAYK